ncbi:VWA domain-containing protein [Persicimonas caeni]|uniref:VWA domain-containing protein n=1 Tax=Persicimonas caeni TaxID=2292766 RepID=A0A4Y6PN04_PERCE|nr:VWA domain-containing protein [Persicimonas caeni]QDG49620.1 VWA domain-containing protein [Persicimonas caeni]QED30841.1 VWA domain-containing protein [Persicimonas caeni]
MCVCKMLWARVHLLILVVVAAASLVSGCTLSDASNCSSDDDCEGGQTCVQSGGLLVRGGGVCVDRTAAALDAGSDTSEADVGPDASDADELDASDVSDVADAADVSDATDAADTTDATDAADADAADVEPAPCTRLSPLWGAGAEPATVTTLFAAEDCYTNAPVADLDETSFVIAEDGSNLVVQPASSMLQDRAHRVYVTLLIDLSGQAQSHKAELQAAAEAFIDKLVAQTGVTNVWVGVELFDGSNGLISTKQLPLRDSVRIKAFLGDAFALTGLDTGATNLNGAVSTAIGNLQSHQKQAMDVSEQGMATSGYLVVLSAGQDTAGYADAATVTAEVDDARAYDAQSPDTPTVQTMGVALQGAAQDRTKLATLLGDDRWVTDTDVPSLSTNLEAVADAIIARIGATYMLAYCSPSRAGSHTSSVELADGSSNDVEVSFSADGFGAGCDASFFNDACQTSTCGGSFCGGCDDGAEICAGDEQLSCLNFCQTQVSCTATAILNPMGHWQNCASRCPATQWSKSFASYQHDSVMAMAADSSGNVVIGGQTTDQLEFGGSQPDYGTWLASFDAAGNYRWSKTLAEQHNFNIHALAVDPADRTVVVGSAFGDFLLDGVQVTTGSNGAAVLAVFDAGGNYVSHHTITYSSGDPVTVVELEIDASGNVFLAGNFEGSINLGGSTLTSSALGGMSDIFVASFDSAFNHRWSKSFGGQYMDAVWTLATTPQGGVVFAGMTDSAVDFGGGTLAQGGAVLVQLDASGNHTWSKSFGHSLQMPANDTAIAVDPLGRVFFAGQILDTVDFGGGLVGSSGDQALVLVGYDSAGAHRLSEVIGRKVNGQIMAVATAVDAWGNVFVAGDFTRTVEFGGQSVTSQATYDTNIFAAVFDESGALEWSDFYGTNDANQVSSALFTSDGVPVMAGVHRNGIDFGQGGLTSDNNGDIFLVGFTYQ